MGLWEIWEIKVKTDKEGIGDMGEKGNKEV